MSFETHELRRASVARGQSEMRGAEKNIGAGRRLARPGHGSSARTACKVLFGFVSALALVTVTVAACGSASSSNPASSASSSSSSLPSAGSSSSSGSSAGTNLTGAKEAIAPYTGHPGAFPVTQPLSKPLPAGTKFAFLQCGTTACGLVGKLLVPAVKAIGGTLTTVNAGSTAQSSQAARLQRAGAQAGRRADHRYRPDVFGGGLKKLVRLPGSRSSRSRSPRTSAAVRHHLQLHRPADDRRLAGKLMADWVIANKGPKANVVFYGVPAINFSGKHAEGFRGGDEEELPVVQGPRRPDRRDHAGHDLREHGRQRSAVAPHRPTSRCSPAPRSPPGLPAAMKAAGLSVTTLGYAPTAGNLQDIKNGGMTAGLAVDLPDLDLGRGRRGGAADRGRPADRAARRPATCRCSSSGSRTSPSTRPTAGPPTRTSRSGSPSCGTRRAERR